MGSYLVNPLSLSTYVGQSAPNGTVVQTGQQAIVSTVGAPVTISAPPQPAADGASFAVVDGGNNAGVNFITLQGNGATIDGAASVVLSVSGATWVFVWDLTFGEWRRVLTPRVFSDVQRVPSVNSRDVLAAISGLQLSGLFANRPAPGLSGRLYFCTDAPYIFFDTGAAWLGWNAPQLGIGPPAAAGFTTVRAGGRATTLVDFADGLSASFTNGTTFDAALFVVGGWASSSRFRARFVGMPQLGNFSGFGLVLRESSTGRFTTLELFNLGAGLSIANIGGSDATNAPATFAVASQPVLSTTSPFAAASEVWFQVEDDGSGGATALTWSYSLNGVHWVTIFQSARNAYFSVAANQLGFGLYNSSGGISVPVSRAVVDSWLLEPF